MDRPRHDARAHPDRRHAGMHLGAYMKGGSIEVSGNASDWIGAEMTGGLIRVRGNAGGQVGAAYRGSLAGMNRRDDPHRRFRRPRSRHAHEARRHRHRRCGPRLRRPADEGRDDHPRQRRRTPHRRLDDPRHHRLPEAAAAPADVRLRLRLQSRRSFALLARYLAGFGFSTPHDGQEGAYQMYAGDTSVPGKGEILVWRPQADATALRIPRKMSSSVACRERSAGRIGSGTLSMR